MKTLVCMLLCAGCLFGLSVVLGVIEHEETA